MPFDPEEVCAAIKRLKRSSSAGPDLLSPRHLLHAGPKISKWLSNIFNSIANLEAIPFLFKKSIVIPIYKEKGKDPLIPTSYRGITLTSVLAKTLEILLQDRMLPLLSDRNIPHTAYSVLCRCHLYLSRDFLKIYLVLRCALIYMYVWARQPLSSSFTVSRGVRQGSVLSPLLFLLIIDPLLLRTSCGPSVCGLYLGAFSHADDIRTLAANISDCQCQINLVKTLPHHKVSR